MGAASMPTQLVVCASSLRGQAWQALLSGQPEITAKGAVADPADVPGLLRPGQPAAVLIDDAAQLQDAARRLKAAAPDAGLLFLVPSYDLPDIILLLRAGADGCLSLQDSVGDLARAIIAVGRGEIVLPTTLASRALATLARGEAQTSTAPLERLIEPLSEREADVLRLLAEGRTNKDIAQTLILSVRTVEAHLRSVYGKLGIRSRTEAALWAVRHGSRTEV
jgi:DNA-binding NarL/FixJ family response regulator